MYATYLRTTEGITFVLCNRL